MTASSTSVYLLARAALTDAGLSVFDGPAEFLPLDGGRVAQAVVLYASPGFHQYSRMSGFSSGREDRVTALCVGATALDALAVADAVEAALGGLAVSVDGGRLRQTVASNPVVEPNSDPRRVSLAVEYFAVTKGELIDAES